MLLDAILGCFEFARTHCVHKMQDGDTSPRH